MDEVEDVTVEVGELETFLLAPSGVPGGIAVLARNACDGGGYRWFGAGVGCEAISGAQSSEGEARCPGELRVRC